MLGIVPGSALRAKAVELVTAFARDCPAAPGEARSALETKVDRALAQLCASTGAYAREQRLGVIGRARLAKALQEELRRTSYSPELVKHVTSAVTVNALVAPGRNEGKR